MHGYALHVTIFYKHLFTVILFSVVLSKTFLSSTKRTCMDMQDSVIIMPMAFSIDTHRFAVAIYRHLFKHHHQCHHYGLPRTYICHGSTCLANLVSTLLYTSHIRPWQNDSIFHSIFYSTKKSRKTLSHLATLLSELSGVE